MSAPQPGAGSPPVAPPPDAGTSPSATPDPRAQRDDRPTAVVIGGGIAGLATAALLSREGYATTLLEAREELGGRAGSWEHAGFRFDTGPSWYLMPEVFDHFYRLLGTSAQERLDLVRLDPGYRVLFGSPERSLDVPADAEETTALFESIEPGAGAALRRYLASAGDAYRMAVRRFLYATYRSPRPLLSRDVLRRLPRLATLLTTSLESFAARRFADPRLRQLLGYPAVFLGASPRLAPAMYHLMSHLDLVDGVRYPQGGFAGLVGGIADLAREQGVDLRTGSTVTAIRTDGRPPRSSGDRRSCDGGGRGGRRPGRRRARVTGVAYRDRDGAEQRIDADVVVAAGDLHHAETRLLPPALQTYPQSWWDRRVPGPGAVLLYLGVRGPLPELAHHTLLFAEDWDPDFDRIFARPARGTSARTAATTTTSLYVCRPSATDPSVAPPGHENLFVLVPVPPDPAMGRGGRDGSGDPGVEEVADAAIAQIAAWAGVADLAERIVVRRTVGPGDFAEDLRSWRGTALGPAHTLRQSAFLRGSNASRRVSGLYYAGASTLPGIGLPMCLISAQLVIKHLRGDTGAGPLEVG